MAGAAMMWFAFILGLSCRRGRGIPIDWSAPKFASRQEEQAYHASMMAVVAALAALSMVALGALR